jgi:hypothetical protein
MKTQITIISLVLMAALAGAASAQVAKSGMAARQAGPGASAVEMKIVDEKGMALRAESLPKDVQANLDRVRKAAESLATTPGSGAAAAQRVKVTVSCSYPPLSCTITIAF